MNKNRRKELEKAINLMDEASGKVSEAKDIIESVREEESEAYDNLPESVRESDRGDGMADNVDMLDEALSSFDDVDEAFDSIVENVRGVIEK